MERTQRWAVRRSSLPTVLPAQDRTFGSLTDGEINSPSSPRHQWDHRRHVPFTHDPESPMPLGEGQVRDVGSARLADPEPIEAEKHGQGGVAFVEVLRREQEGAQLPAIETSPLRGVNLRSSDVLGGVSAHPAVDVGKAVEATDGGQPAVDGGRCKTSLLHRSAVELDVRSLRLQDGQAHVGGPLEECPQIVAISGEGATVVPGKKSCGRDLSLIEARIGNDGGQGVWI